jgi:predicted Zn-dependent peptidase
MYDANATLPAFHLGYHIPPSRTPDHYALEMLAMVLGDGESSRLYQTLVKQKEICQDVAVGTDDRRGPDLFSAWVVMASGHAPREGQAIVFAELDSIAKKGVTERELQKAKNRIRASFVFGLQSNMARSQHLAEFELYWGDANLLKLELDHYLAVSMEDIKRVAGTYFEASNRTVLDVMPGTDPALEEK